jgi:hypothetical protein
MALQLDLERLLMAAQASGALNGVGTGYKETSLSLSGQAVPMFGCCALWTQTGDSDLLSLTIPDEPFMSWLGWQLNDECTQVVKLLTYMGPDGASLGTQATGAAAACDPAAGVEFGTCEVLLPDKGRIKRAGPVRDLTENNRKPYNGYPIFTKDGVAITDEIMWSLALAGTALKQDLMRMVVIGNSATSNEFAGLQQLVNTGYKNMHDGSLCPAMDSLVLDWDNHDMSWAKNGRHVLVDYLIDIVRRIRLRASWSSLGRIERGDMVLMMPSFLRDTLLDFFTCWSVCPGSQYNETNMNTFEARQFRQTLNGGQFNDGQIFVDGEPLPIIVYNYAPFSQAAPYFTGDMYILTRKLQSVPILYGQYIDMAKPASRFAEEAGYGHYKSTDGGRFLTYWKTDNECIQSTVVMRPNLYLAAPWAQARITDINALRPLAPVVPDPTSGYYVGGEIAPAYCPEDYLVAGEPR